MHEGWTVRAVGGAIPDSVAGIAIPATVPGCVHLDLLDAGLIPDPYLDRNELEVAWIGHVDWRYETTVHVAAEELAGERLDLVAEGLDTLATVEVNGTEIARTYNQHRSYRFDVRAVLREGANTLAITFAAAVPAVTRIDAQAPRPHVNTHPFNAIRKMACNFGWDWGAELVTAGIWRPLSLHTWAGARIASVRPLVDVRYGTPILTAHVELERAAADGPLALTCSVDGITAPARVLPGDGSATIRLEVPDAQLWWPHGYGDQPLYDVHVTLADGATALDTWSGRVGFRTTELETRPDEHGTSFTIKVNGRPIFVKGVNWVPGDSFPARLTRTSYSSLLQQAKAANVNLLRVWGGGIYESADFYDLCDELGLMVWQDFLLACAAYSEEEPLRSELVAEARENVTRLSGHASLVIWNGGNENIWGFEDWGWPDALAGRTWGLAYYEEIFPAVLAELDPTRPYSPGSPYSFTKGEHPNDPAHGCTHIWDVWNQRDYTAYATYSPRFVSEFGFQGPPTWATLTRAIHDEPLSATSAGMLLHQKAEDGNEKLNRGLVPHLPEPTSFADWHWATSLNQARAVRFGVEHFRGQSPTCMGTIVWQLNDTWPVTSWAAVDGDGRRKPLWYALEAAFRPRLLTFEAADGGLELRAVNDTDAPWREPVSITAHAVEGNVVALAGVTLDLDARETVRIRLGGELGSVSGPDGALVLAAETSAGRAVRFYAEDVAGRLPDPELDAEVEPIDGGYAVHLTARSLLRDVALLADRLAPDAVADRSLLTLFPGETATVTVRTQAELTAAQLTSPEVLRSANQLVQTARARS